MDSARPQQTSMFYHFGEFTLDVSERLLRRADVHVPLKPKQFDLLFFFVRNAGRTTKKDELLSAVWPDTYVEENTLARNVSWLRTLLEDDLGGERVIETVPKLGYRFTPEVTTSRPTENTLIVEEQTVQYFRGVETITVEDSTVSDTVVTREHQGNSKLSLRRMLLASAAVVIVVALAGIAFSSYWKNTQPTAAESVSGKNTGGAIDPRQGDQSSRKVANVNSQIRIGSIVNLQNRYPNDGSYLDAWGAVWAKPEFRQVPTETMFVSTHVDPNRDNGSGSWEIISASGKGKEEPLVVGDRIHLRNMHPNAGYLDACGWTEHLSVFEKFQDQTGAVFTTRSPNRDNGTGTWIIRSATLEDGSPLVEGDSIAIESSYFINDAGKNRVSGFLNVAGKVSDIEAFKDHQGAKLVFTKSLSYDQPVPDIWTITASKTFSKQR
ncbi:MAG: transcriptional regulator [Pyrinomonadaceae bacterium]